MPAHLRRYIRDRLHSVFLGDTQSQSRPRGRKADANLRRNYAIVMALAKLISRGLHPTRNQETAEEKESACSIVAAALKCLNIDLSESAVAKVWAGHSDLTKIWDFR